METSGVFIFSAARAPKPAEVLALPPPPASTAPTPQLPVPARINPAPLRIVTHSRSHSSPPLPAPPAPLLITTASLTPQLQPYPSPPPSPQNPPKNPLPTAPTLSSSPQSLPPILGAPYRSSPPSSPQNSHLLPQPPLSPTLTTQPLSIEELTARTHALARPTFKKYEDSLQENVRRAEARIEAELSQADFAEYCVMKRYEAQQQRLIKALSSQKETEAKLSTLSSTLLNLESDLKIFESNTTWAQEDLVSAHSVLMKHRGKSVAFDLKTLFEEFDQALSSFDLFKIKIEESTVGPFLRETANLSSQCAASKDRLKSELAPFDRFNDLKKELKCALSRTTLSDDAFIWKKGDKTLYFKGTSLGVRAFPQLSFSIEFFDRPSYGLSDLCILLDLSLSDYNQSQDPLENWKNLIEKAVLPYLRKDYTVSDLAKACQAPSLRAHDLNIHLKCPVLRGPFEKPHTLLCGHTFSKDHLPKEDCRCPTCKAPFKSDQILSNNLVGRFTETVKELLKSGSSEFDLRQKQAVLIRQYEYIESLKKQSSKEIQEYEAAINFFERMGKVLIEDVKAKIKASEKRLDTSAGDLVVKEVITAPDLFHKFQILFSALPRKRDEIEKKIDVVKREIEEKEKTT